MAHRETFGGRWAAMFAMAGSAIGLGNIWRFPYMVGQNGGAAFILIYLIFVFLLSLPILLSESIIGRSAGANTFGAMKILAPGTKWKWLGLLSVISPFVILSYYNVVGGWSLGFFVESVTHGFGEGSVSKFSQFAASPFASPLCNFLFLAASGLIVSLGVKKGIEKFNKVSLPLLFCLIVLIGIYSLSLPGAMDGVRYLVEPDFSKLSTRSLAYAMGQGFFSLSLGVGTILTYSSYMSKRADLLGSGAGTAFCDVMFAILAGFAVIPAVFAAGIEPGAGPGLVFESLPYVFASMSDASPLLSRAVSILFFFTIVIAALTSSISMFEVIVAYLSEEKGLSRRRATLLFFSVLFVSSTFCSLTFGPLKNLNVFGMPVFDFLDMFASNYLMTTGAFLFVIFVGWKMEKVKVYDEITNCGYNVRNNKLFGPVYFLIRFVAPVAILMIFITNFIL